MRVNLKVDEIKLEQLNTECLVLTSKFARVLKHYNGRQIKMQQPRVLGLIERYAKSTRNEELKEIYSELKAGIIVSMYDARNSASQVA